MSWSYRQNISSSLDVRLKRTCTLACRALKKTVNKLNDVNLIYLKIIEIHRGAQKTPRGVSAGLLFETLLLNEYLPMMD